MKYLILSFSSGNEAKCQKSKERKWLNGDGYVTLGFQVPSKREAKEI